MKQEQLSFCRIAWKIAGKKGHGDWFDITDEKLLSKHVKDLN